MKKRKKEVFEHQNHPVFQLHNRRTLGQKAADRLTIIAGSWTFIILLFAFLITWMIINSYIFLHYAKGDAFDPYPFILLNLVLSCLAAIQAPVILMSQNRLAQRDRIKAEFDYRINKKAEEEIRELRDMLVKHWKKK